MSWISAFEQRKRWEEATKKNIPESKGYLEFLDPETSGFSFVASKNKPNVNSKNWNRSDFWYNPVAENWTVANVSGTKDYIAPSGWIPFKDVAFEENGKMKIPKNSPSVYSCSSCGTRHTGFHTCSKNSESGGWFSDLSNAIGGGSLVTPISPALRDEGRPLGSLPGKPFDKDLHQGYVPTEWDAGNGVGMMQQGALQYKWDSQKQGWYTDFNMSNGKVIAPEDIKYIAASDRPEWNIFIPVDKKNVSGGLQPSPYAPGFEPKVGDWQQVLINPAPGYEGSLGAKWQWDGKNWIEDKGEGKILTLPVDKNVSGGLRTNMPAVTKIEDPNGNLLWEDPDPNTAFDRLNRNSPFDTLPVDKNVSGMDNRVVDLFQLVRGGDWSDDGNTPILGTKGQGIPTVVQSDPFGRPTEISYSDGSNVMINRKKPADLSNSASVSTGWLGKLSQDPKNYSSPVNNYSSPVNYPSNPAPVTPPGPQLWNTWRSSVGALVNPPNPTPVAAPPGSQLRNTWRSVGSPEVRSSVGFVPNSSIVGLTAEEMNNLNSGGLWSMKNGKVTPTEKSISSAPPSLSAHLDVIGLGNTESFKEAKKIDDAAREMVKKAHRRKAIDVRKNHRTRKNILF